MSDTRIIFGNVYYKLKAITLSDKFKKLSEEFYAKVASIGEPVPKEGFEKASEYLDWRVRLEGKDIFIDDELQKILHRFNVNPKSREGEQLSTGLRWIVIFKHKIDEAPMVGYISLYSESGLKLNKDGESFNLTLTVHKNATREDFEKLDTWKIIQQSKNDLWNKRSKNKPWENFDKDFAVYKLYLRVKEDIRNGTAPKTKTPSNMVVSKSVYTVIQDYPEFDELTKLYKGNSDLSELLRSIISRCKNVFGDLQLS